jgi:type IV secretion system protein VirB1
LTVGMGLWSIDSGKWRTGDAPICYQMSQQADGRNVWMGGAVLLPGIEMMGCQGLAVPSEVMHHVVQVESSYNPYAIGVVGGRLVRQPKNLPEALATVRMLESRGFNFSIGLAQVNRYNLDKYGLDSYEKAFDACANLSAGSKILAECYRRAGGDWGKSFSCYYSGNFSTGFRHGYVQKIYSSIRQGREVDAAPGSPAIDVVDRGARRTVPVSRHPLYSGNASTEVPGVPSPYTRSAVAAPSRVQSVPSRFESADVVDPVAAFIAAAPPQRASASPEPTPAPVALPPDIGRAVLASDADIGRAVVVGQPAGNASASVDQQAAPKRRTSASDKAYVVTNPDQDDAFVF